MHVPSWFGVRQFGSELIAVTWPVVDVLPEICTPVVDEVDDEFELPEVVVDNDPVLTAVPVVDDEETIHWVPLKAYPGKHEKQWPR